MLVDEFGPILDQEVYEAATECSIVEEYPDDRPYPSVLVLGRTSGGAASPCGMCLCG